MTSLIVRIFSAIGVRFASYSECMALYHNFMSCFGVVSSIQKKKGFLFLRLSLGWDFLVCLLFKERIDL